MRLRSVLWQGLKTAKQLLSRAILCASYMYLGNISIFYGVFLSAILNFLLNTERASGMRSVIYMYLRTIKFSKMHQKSILENWTNSNKKEVSNIHFAKNKKREIICELYMSMIKLGGEKVTVWVLHIVKILSLTQFHKGFVLKRS